MKKRYLSLLMIIANFCLLNAQSKVEEMALYSGAIPNAKTLPDTETVEQRDNGGRFIFDTAIPTLTAYLPKHPNGKAIVVCPGGGYRGTAIDKEGLLVAQTLNEDSITAFVLKYRIPQDATNVDKSLAPLQDAQQAIRFVRKNAAKYRLNPAQIGIMGFSAGGHLAASAATRFQKLADSNELDTTSVRPDFAVLIYPVISFTDELTHKGSRTNLLGDHPTKTDIMLCSAEMQVTPNSPPAFLVHAADDKVVPVGNSLAYYTACINHDVSAEMHLYPKGGHGFGMFNTTTADIWMERLINWLKTI
ncbi:MAG: endo-1,4-beta-xylanase [Saprospiraceae bacterium]|nr:MAG: endo-1,4-beta-xylanase [Saprospiraceae bacterium]